MAKQPKQIECVEYVIPIPKDVLDVLKAIEKSLE
jgi:hypothetical protein